ncbi:thermonuclease family protein [Pseudorhodoplanes sp.]|uniref:thermonuclease family protein n=1 Tax=Pseudorhodoplanes sp. TaxID=1934341 RepID=UPI00391CDE98
MFLRARLPSGPPVAVLIGLVFVAGMAAGAALQSRSSGAALVVARPAAEAASAPADRSDQTASALENLRLAAGGHPADVLRVNDGDTFEARVHVWPGMQVTTRVRLRGIDAAEFRARCAEEYRLAVAARDALSRLLADGGVTIGRIDFDKYGGRVVANAATRTTPDVSEALLKTGLVRPYDGGRRESWCGG